MITFIKASSFEIIKKKLLLLYILNVTDITLTIILLSTGFFTEANILIADLLHDPIDSFILKFLFPAILLLYLYKRMQKATDHQLKKSNFLINGVLLLYVLINISHLLWFAMLPIFKSF